MKPTNDNVQDFLARSSEIEQHRISELLNQKIISLLEMMRLLLQTESMDTPNSGLMNIITRAQSTLQNALSVSSPIDKLSMTGFAIDTLLDHPEYNKEIFRRHRMQILRHFGEMAKVAKNEEAAHKAVSLMKKG